MLLQHPAGFYPLQLLLVVDRELSVDKDISDAFRILQRIFITVVTALFVTALNTFIMYVDSKVYSYPFAATLPTVALRIVAGIVTAVVFSLILPSLLSALRRILGKEKDPAAPAE